MASYSNEERADMMLAFGEAQKNASLAARIYAQKFPHRCHPDHRTISAMFSNLTNYGSFFKPREREASARTGEATSSVLDHVRDNPHASVRSTAAALNLTPTTTWRILNATTHHPYRPHVHQNLTDRDFERRVEYANWALAAIEDEGSFLSKIIWTDEARFGRSGTVNTQNRHYWSTTNPYWLLPDNHQWQWSFNVWCGIHVDRVIGPYFFDGHLTGERYIGEVLDNVLQDYLDDMPLSDLRGVWYQHDGAPAHAYRRSCLWLDSTFGRKWIGPGGPVLWPARSPDLTPLDFFLWGHIKERVYDSDPVTPANLKLRIQQCCEQITAEQLRRTTQATETRIRMCLAAEGRHFEHAL